jgi:putative DNA methylase
LLKPDDYEEHSRFGLEDGLTIWGALHSTLQQSVEGGISAAGRMLAAIRAGNSGVDDSALLELAHLLFRVAEQNKWTTDAISFNNLVTAWPEILDEARAAKADGQQHSLAFDTHD